MNGNPILIFPKPTGTTRKKLTARPTKVHFPSPERQVQRLEPQFKILQDVFKHKNLDILSEPTGAQPEHVLVLETVGTIKDFFKAVKKIDGMEWLAEWEEQFDADEDFFKENDADKKEKALGGRLFLVMANQTALSQLLSLWNRFKEGKKQDTGLAKWSNLFKQVRNIRTWNIEDRILETGVLEEWQERVQSGEETVKFEAELWYRYSKEERHTSFSLIKRLIEKDGGQILQQAIIPEIAYHSILGELPIQLVGEVLDYTKIQVLKCHNVMFIRPVGQTSVALPDLDYYEEFDDERLEKPSGEPIIALLDGLPLEKHTLLDGRIIVDDPDNWSADYRPSEQFHGTAMASLILHGELDNNTQPLKTPLYVRPIFKPDNNDWRAVRSECIPDNILPIDLIHRTIKRIFDGTELEPPAAPSVRIVNLSVGDRARQFVRAISPWAKLLDWLAWEYSILFIVSVGNHSHDIVLDIPRTSLNSLTDDELQKEAVKAIANDARNRRLLSPAEAINALSIGALHTDSSTINYLGTRRNIYQNETFPSPINAVGLGYRRSIKPDVLMPGGKQLFTEKLGTTHNKATLCVNNSLSSPGQKVATVGSKPGELSNTCFIRGTSNAAALATRAAASVHETIQTLRENQDGGNLLNNMYAPVLIKTLLIHSARWGNTSQQFKDILGSIKNFKEHLSRFVGYGALEVPRVLECTDQRATLIGCGSIADGDAHVFNIPLPPSLSGKKIWRRLTITLAWLTPINPFHQAYRRAALWVDPPKSELQIDRTEADGRAVARGTVQHEILEGDNATAFVDGDNLEVIVNCRADAGELPNSVPYALAVSLEVAEGIEVPIYEEIRERVLIKIRTEVSS